MRARRLRGLGLAALLALGAVALLAIVLAEGYPRGAFPPLYVAAIVLGTLAVLIGDRVHAVAQRERQRAREFVRANTERRVYDTERAAAQRRWDWQVDW